MSARLPDCTPSAAGGVLEACSGGSCTEASFRSCFPSIPVGSGVAWEPGAFFSPLRLAGDMGDLARDKLIKLLSRICLERIIKYVIAHVLLQRTSASAKDGVSSNTAQKQGPHTLRTAGHHLTHRAQRFKTTPGTEGASQLALGDSRASGCFTTKIWTPQTPASLKDPRPLQQKGAGV